MHWVQVAAGLTINWIATYQPLSSQRPTSTPRQLRSEYVSSSARKAVHVSFGISVPPRRNPHPARKRNCACRLNHSDRVANGCRQSCVHHETSGIVLSSSAPVNYRRPGLIPVLPLPEGDRRPSCRQRNRGAPRRRSSTSALVSPLLTARGARPLRFRVRRATS